MAPQYAAFVEAPRALPDGLIFVFQQRSKGKMLYYHLKMIIMIKIIKQPG
jgi:hypothetical protein